MFITLVKIYFLHMYGSSLWDFYDDGATGFWTEWHKLIKNQFSLPLPTHRYIVTELADCAHPMKLVIKRFLKFSNKLANSENIHIKLLHNKQKGDMRSTYGRNIHNICQQAGVNDIRLVDIDNILVNPVPHSEQWRMSMLRDLLHERDSPCGFLSQLETFQMIHSVCCD